MHSPESLVPWRQVLGLVPPRGDHTGSYLLLTRSGPLRVALRDVSLEALLPVLTFVGITGFLQGNTLQVLLVAAVAYGFATVALLVPAIGAFDMLTGRTTAGA